MDLTNLKFSSSVIAVYAVTGALMILMAVTGFLLWKKRTNAPLKPIFTGAAVFLLFALVLKAIPSYPLLAADNAVSRTINTTPWLYYLTGGLMAGIFEETGRFLAFKTVLKSHTKRRTALDYGVGHGGFELLYVGITTASIVAMGIIVNSSGAEALFKDLPEWMLPAAEKQVQKYASATVLTLLLGLVERISAVMLQIGLSVLVYRAARGRKAIWLYPAAVLLHTAIDFSLFFAEEHPYLTEAMLLVCALTLLLIAVKIVYPHTPEKEEGSV